MYEAWSTVGFYDENDKISKNAIALLLMSQKYGGNSGNFVFDHT